jgi:hypothetical protein
VAVNVSTQVDTTRLGVLSGSVAFTRPDAGSNFVGGPNNNGVPNAGVRTIGVFINSANGNPYENTPGTASGVGPYVSAMGTYGNALFETFNINTGAALTYAVGDVLVASFNGYLTNVTAANNALDRTNGCLDSYGAASAAGAAIIGVLKMPADATQDELVYDQRI